jgi:hypothetical protein
VNATEPQPPYAAYAALTGVFVGGVALTASLGGRLGQVAKGQGPFDLVVLGLATFKAARTVARDEVTSFVREPFVDGSIVSGEQTPVHDGGVRQAVGELVTCSRCVGTWAAAGLAATHQFAPRFGRTLSWALAIGAVNDWLQAGFTALANEANRADR